MKAGILGWIAVSTVAGLGLMGCSESTVSPGQETALLSVAPEGGAQDIAADSATIEVAFDHAMHEHATEYLAVHEGDVTGPEVMGSWQVGGNGTHIRFVPEAGLKDGTRYTIHLGGGLEDAEGHHVDLETYGMSMGGMWADGSMMMGGMMGGDHPHMGESWQDPGNGSYGMVFTFTTSA